MISAPTLAATNDQMTCCSQRSRIGRPLTGMRLGGTSSPVAAAAFTTRSSLRFVPFCPTAPAGGGLAEFGFADGVEAGDAGFVRDGAVETDPGPAAVELEGGEHVVEPGAAGDPPPDPRPGRPGQPGHTEAGHAAGA